MNLTDDQYNQLMAIYLEWGPRLRIPVTQRWLEAFPQATQQDLLQWKAAADAIRHQAFLLAKQAVDQNLPNAAVVTPLASAFPRLSSENLNRFGSQAFYTVIK